MNKFKVGDIVLATADNDEFLNKESRKLFIVIELLGNSQPAIMIDSPKHYNGISGLPHSYYEYKFRKATRKEVKKFKFDYIVHKLKGGRTIELEKII